MNTEYVVKGERDGQTEFQAPVTAQDVEEAEIKFLVQVDAEFDEDGLVDSNGFEVSEVVPKAFA